MNRNSIEDGTGRERRRPPDLRVRLTEDVGAYLRISRADHDAEELHLRSVCSTLAWLLGRLLQGCEGWHRYRWVDDILAVDVDIISSEEFNIYGWMIWGEGGPRDQLVDPFFAAIRLPGKNDARITYQLKCGDASRGLGKLHYGDQKKRRNRQRPGKWLFEFTQDSEIPS